MKKIFINDLDQDRRDNLIKKNRLLIERLQNDLYEQQMFMQQEEGELMLGKEHYKYIDIKDDYSSFFLVLRNWSKFIENLDKDYLCQEGIDLYNKIIEKKKAYENTDAYSEEFDRLEGELEEDCKELLDICEKQLHEYESLPSEDDAISYADEMEQLEEYYIEEREDGTTDGVIRRDVSYTETFI